MLEYFLNQSFLNHISRNVLENNIHQRFCFTTDTFRSMSTVVHIQAPINFSRVSSHLAPPSTHAHPKSSRRKERSLENYSRIELRCRPTLFEVVRYRFTERIPLGHSTPFGRQPKVLPSSKQLAAPNGQLASGRLFDVSFGNENAGGGGGQRLLPDPWKSHWAYDSVEFTGKDIVVRGQAPDIYGEGRRYAE